MRRGKRLAHVGMALLCLLGLLSITGCAPYKAAVIPPLGFIYSEVSAPLVYPDENTSVVNLDEVEIYTTHFQIPYSYLRIINVGWGDAAVKAAVAESGFSEVHFADYTYFTILSIYSTFTVRVYGTS